MLPEPMSFVLGGKRDLNVSRKMHMTWFAEIMQSVVCLHACIQFYSACGNKDNLCLLVLVLSQSLWAISCAA